jgi:F0F1-type ATP synthase assembly protein I
MTKKNNEFSLWKKLRKPDQTILKYFGLVSQLGLSFISAFLILFFLFLFLDKKLKTNGILLIIGTILGVASGIFTAYKILKKYYEK